MCYSNNAITGLKEAEFVKSPRSKRFKRIYIKLMRHPGSPEYVARGVAIGFFTAFFIPFSFQMPVALALSIQLRAARISSMLFTWITNPFTIPIFYPLQCYVGSKIIHVHLSYPHVKEQLTDIARTPSLKAVAALGSEVLLSFFVGGLLFGSIATKVSHYAPCSVLVVR